MSTDEYVVFWPAIALGIRVLIAVANELPATNIVKTVNTWKKKIDGKFGKPTSQ